MDNVLFNQLTDKHALKFHGLLTDEDGSTDSDSKSDFDELYALYKPPPLNIPPDRIVVIKAVRSEINKELGDVQEKKPDVAEKKKLSHRNEQKEKTRFNISVNNFYEALQQSDSEDNSRNSVVNKHTDEDDVSIEVTKRKNKRRRKRKTQKKILVENSSSFMNCLNGCLWNKENNCNEFNHCRKRKVVRRALRERYDEDAFTSDMNFFLNFVPWYFWSEDILTHITACEEKMESHQTSWDHISTNRVYRSDKLIQQEYYNIVGSKKCSYTGSENRRTAALRNLLQVNGAQLVLYVSNKFLSVLNNRQFLTVFGGILLAAFIYTRRK